MTDDDKALVERLRGDLPDKKVESHWITDYTAVEMQNREAANRIEAQAAEIEALKTLLVATGQVAASHFKTAKERAAEIEELKSWKAAEDAHHHKLRTEIERLRKAGTKMAGYAGHDDNCEIMLKGVWGDNTPCDCGYEDAWKALRDALGETE